MAADTALSNSRCLQAEVLADLQPAGTRSAPPTLAVAPRPPVPAAIYNDADAMLLKRNTNVVGADASKPDALPVAVPADFMFRSFDIESQFAFQPVATPPAVRLQGFEFLPDDAHLPLLLKAELQKGDAECFKITGKRGDEPAGSAKRAPGFDDDGRAD